MYYEGETLICSSNTYFLNSYAVFQIVRKCLTLDPTSRGKAEDYLELAEQYLDDVKNSDSSEILSRSVQRNAKSSLLKREEIGGTIFELGSDLHQPIEMGMGDKDICHI